MKPQDYLNTNEEMVRNVEPQDHLNTNEETIRNVGAQDHFYDNKMAEKTKDLYRKEEGSSWGEGKDVSHKKNWRRNILIILYIVICILFSPTLVFIVYFMFMNMVRYTMGQLILLIALAYICLGVVFYFKNAKSKVDKKKNIRLLIFRLLGAFIFSITIDMIVNFIASLTNLAGGAGDGAAVLLFPVIIFSAGSVMLLKAIRKLQGSIDGKA